MTPVVTADQMRALDRAAIEELGIPSLVLMETAGRAVAEVVERAARSASPSSAGSGSVLVLAGRGNNGGDGFVVARSLFDRGLPVEVLWVAGERASADCETQCAIARRLGVPVTVASGGELLRNFDHKSNVPVIVDALFGTGLAREIQGDLRALIERVNASKAVVVAVDIPSGIDADTGQILGVAIEADETVTFAFPKFGHLMFPGRGCSGRLVVADIGIPRRTMEAVMGRPALWLSEAVVLEARPPRAVDAHKGTFGHVAVVAGSPDRPGAALLASRAALRAGAGLVTLASEDAVIARIAGVLDEIMGLSVSGSEGIDAERLILGLERRRVNALVIGPSLDPGPSLESLLHKLLSSIAIPVVIDAGALDAIGNDPGWLRELRCVLTPHPGEMARILGIDVKTVQSNRVDAARALAEASGSVVVSKGASTLIVEPDGSVFVSTFGNSGMATGGSGDVLAGVIGAFLAQGCSTVLAAKAGVVEHGRAGDRARAKRGERLVASDLIEELTEIAR